MFDVIRTAPGGRLVQDRYPARRGAPSAQHLHLGTPALENRDLSAAELNMLGQPLIRLARTAEMPSR